VGSAQGRPRLSAAVAVACSAVHAVLIVGTMGPVSKAVLCAAAVAATCWAVLALRVWGRRKVARG
jgi:hypothetical protein